MYNFPLIPLFGGIINITLAVFVLFINPKRRVNRIFCALGLGLAWWNLGIYSLVGSADGSETLFRTRLTVMGCVFVPALIYHLAAEVSKLSVNRPGIILPYVVAAVFVCLDFTSYVIKGVRPVGSSYYAAEAGPAFWFFCCVFVPVVGFGSLSVLVAFVRQVPRQSARAAKCLIVAVVLIFAGLIHDALIVLGLEHYPGTHLRVITWGTLGASFYGLIIGYGVLSDQLFDVRISISRHSATLLRLGFLGGIAYLLLLAVGALSPDTFTQQGLVASLMILLFSAAVTSRIFPKLFGGISARVEQEILGDHFEYRDKFAAFIHSPQRSEALQNLLDSAVNLVFGQLSLSAAAIAITGGDSKIRGEAIRVVGGESKWHGLLGAKSALIQCFARSKIDKIDTRDDFQFRSDLHGVYALLKSLSVEHAFAIGSRSNEPLGLLVIGPRRDGRPLTKLDIDLLQSLCRNLEARVERIAILQNEELRQANSSKDRFLASINHEIRNPLNGITGIVQMLLETPSDPRSKYLLSTLEACTEQLRSSMDDVLDFTQIETDTVTVTASEVNLNELVRTSCAGSDMSGTRIIVRSLPKAVIPVLCDAGKLRQIISNYLANSLKYGDPPGAEVTLDVDGAGAGRVCATITVTSRGTTLSPAELGVLFTALTRGQRARETNAHGTGLGLALCKRLAHAIGGSVGVNSANGQTHFWFKAEFPMVSESSLQPLLMPVSYSGLRVLAIEDEPYNRVVLEHHLKRFDLAPTWAESGKTALAAAQNVNFDLILMDWLLPDMDGAELLDKLKGCRSGILPPVIVLSAYSTTTKRSECLAAGAVAFVSKPIDLVKLSVALERCKLGVA